MNNYKTRKSQLQKQRAQVGKDWERTVFTIADGMGWARLWPKSYTGQPFDISACIDGESYGIECKHISKGNLGYSSLRSNEIENLSRHEDAGGISVIAIMRDYPALIAFVPWYAVRNDILSGEKGSIKPAEYPSRLEYVKEVPRP